MTKGIVTKATYTMENSKVTEINAIEVMIELYSKVKMATQIETERKMIKSPIIGVYDLGT